MAVPTDSASDLIGDLGSGDSNAPTASNPGALNAVNNGVAEASGAQDEKAKEVERQQIKQLWAEYETAREFDKYSRIGFATDRRYAAGLGDPSWASDANLIGSFIDILTSFLYAQNPDVSCRAAAQVGDTPNDDNTDFAETLELVISRLWKIAKLKKTARRMVRSALTVGEGWMKALMWSSKRPQPQLERQLRDAEDAAASLTAAMTELQTNPGDDPDVKKADIQLKIAGLKANIEKAKKIGLSTDYVRAEDMTVSLDVSAITDHLSADWNSEDIYIPQTSLLTRFPRLTDEDCKRATLYYQKNTATNAKGDILQAATGDEAADGQYSKSQPSSGSGTGNKPVQFVKIVELWDSRDSNIKTMVDGLDRWAVEPYTPPQATNRFYPYFELEFYPVDGMRHSQSLPGRLKKLQDEYSAARSNQRLTRERSIPGLIFNAGLVSPEDAVKLSASVIAEMVPLKLTDINIPIQNVVMVKPLPTIDVRLWDTTAIRSDMEALSGVQEALQQGSQSQQPKTATEAQIEQTGFASRTSADRDAIEDVLIDLANYSAECGIQEIPAEEAQRIAGAEAFWPEGMDVQDLLTMVNVEIQAGTTGKPNTAADKQNWATILPLLQKLMVQCRQLQSSDPALGECLENLMKETIHRLDDRLDVTQFITSDPPPPPPPAPKPMPSVSVALKGTLPALDAAAIGAQAAGLPPEAMLAGGGAGAPAAVLPGAPDHPGAHIADGEIPLHPHMPQPLPAVQKTPADGGETQKPKV